MRREIFRSNPGVLFPIFVGVVIFHKTANLVNNDFVSILNWKIMIKSLGNSGKLWIWWFSWKIFPPLTYLLPFFSISAQEITWVKSLLNSFPYSHKTEALHSSTYPWTHVMNANYSGLPFLSKHDLENRTSVRFSISCPNFERMTNQWFSKRFFLI